MNMNCSRDHSSERKQKILPWITMIIGLTLTTFVVILLTQLINLSRNVDVSRRTLSEMSGRLQKIQKENDEMKKELRNTKSKIEKLLRRFPSPQKVSAQVRRTTRAQGAGHNLLPLNNITRKCACEPTAAYIHVNTTDAGSMFKDWNKTRDGDSLKIGWKSPCAKLNIFASLPDQPHIKIARNGTYGVYCNLRINTTWIKAVKVMVGHQHVHHDIFYYMIPSHSKTAFHEVRFFGLVSIRNGSKLSVHLEFKTPNPWEDERTDEFQKFLLSLFDDYQKVNNNNNFGVFSVQ